MRPNSNTPGASYVPPARQYRPPTHADEQKRLGSIPAHLDPSIGGLFTAKSRAARLLRQLHLAGDVLPSVWSISDLRNSPCASTFPSGALEHLSPLLQVLYAAGCVDLARQEECKNYYSLRPLSEVDVHVSDTMVGLKRIIAWLLFQRRTLQSIDPEAQFVRAKDVCDVLAKEGLPLTRARFSASTAIRSLAESDPDTWELVVSGATGRLTISMRDRHPGATTYIDARDTLVRMVHERVCQKFPPVLSLNDLQADQLHRLWPQASKPRRHARQALHYLCTTPGKGRMRQLAEVGVHRGTCLYSTTEFVDVARRWLSLTRLARRAEQELLEWRRISRCEIMEVRTERAAVLAGWLTQAYGEIVQVVSAPSRSTQLKLEQVRARLERKCEQLKSAISGHELADYVAGETRLPRIGRGEVRTLVRWARRWRSSRFSETQLDTRVVNRVHRWYAADADASEKDWTARTAYYSLFEVRAQLLIAVGDSWEQSVARRVHRFLGAEPSFEAIASGLRQKEVGARLLAAAAMGVWGDGAAMPLLRSAASKDEAGVREVALWSMAILASSCVCSELEIISSGLSTESKNRCRRWCVVHASGEV